MDEAYALLESELTSSAVVARPAGATVSMEASWAGGSLVSGGMGLRTVLDVFRFGAVTIVLGARG